MNRSSQQTQSVLLRLPTHWEEVPIPGRPNPVNIPRYAQFHEADIIHVAHVTSSNGFPGSKISLGPDIHIETAVSEEEIAFIRQVLVPQLAPGTVYTWDRRQHTDSSGRPKGRLASFQDQLRGGSTRSAEDFLDQPAQDEEGRDLTSPTDSDRVGPGQWCSWGEHAIEDGQKAVVEENDFICWECYQASLEEEAAEPEGHPEELAF